MLRTSITSLRRQYYQFAKPTLGSRQRGESDYVIRTRFVEGLCMGLLGVRGVRSASVFALIFMEFKICDLST